MEETMDDLKLAYELLFAENARLRGRLESTQGEIMNIEKSQMEFMKWAEMSESRGMPACIKGFGDSSCDHPSCSCGAMPIKAEAFPPIQFAGPEPVQRDSFRTLALYCLGSAAVTLAVVVVIAGVFG